MKNQRNTPEYWASLVAQHFHLGNEVALVPAKSFSEQTAIELADRLDAQLGRWEDDYIFQQKKPDAFVPRPDVVLH